MRSAVIAALILGPMAAFGVIWYFDLFHKPVEKQSVFHGRSHQEVTEQLGRPTRSTKFKMSDSVGEFRIELCNFYPPTNPKNNDVEILEETWVHARYSITLWFHDTGRGWIVLDSCRWKKGVQF